MKRLLSTLLFVGLSVAAMAQEQPAPGTEETSADGTPVERVQYALILPEEKNAEMVKAEENNPFEAVTNVAENEGDTEENRVRDILLTMPAVGGGSGPDGMRVMLGSMRLEAGQMVPNVLPDQQVMLKVKSVTPQLIELIWVEQKPSGLPPKPFVIPVDVSPSVRYRMPSGNGEQKGGIGTMRRAGFSAFNVRPDAQDQSAQEVTAAKAIPVEEKAAKPAPASTPPAANVPEASVLRMLFGNHGPQGK